jgi:hypothetical protein
MTEQLMAKMLARSLCYALLAAVGLAGWTFLTRSEPKRFGANAEPVPPSGLLVAYGYGVTLVGVVLGSAYRELQARKARGEVRIANWRKFASPVFRSIDLWMSLCGSPLVYAFLWRSFDGAGMAALTTVALQNGFCCTVIISSLISKGGDATPGSGNGP